MPASWEGNVDITVTFGAAPFPTTSFSDVLVLVDAANSNLGANTVVKGYEQDEQDQVDTDWTQNEVDIFDTYFAQLAPKPTTIYFGEWDSAGGETPDAALNKIIDANDNWYGVAIDSRTDSEQDTLSAEIESNTKPMIHLLQSSTADIVEQTSLPSPLSNLTDRERTMGLYHPTDTEYLDVGMAGAGLRFDQDRTANSWNQEVRGVADVVGNLPSNADIGSLNNPGNLINNGFNTGLPFQPADFFVNPGQNTAQRDMKIVVTRDWYEARVNEDVRRLIVTATRRGQTFEVGPVDTTETDAQLKMANIIEDRFEQGVEIGHFSGGEIDIDYPTVTQTNVNNNVVPLDVNMTVAVAGKAINFDFNFTTSTVT